MRRVRFQGEVLACRASWATEPARSCLHAQCTTSYVRDVLSKWQWHRTGSSWSPVPVRTLSVAPLWCDLGFVPNSRGNNAAANLSPMHHLSLGPFSGLVSLSGPDDKQTMRFAWSHRASLLWTQAYLLGPPCMRHYDLLFPSDLNASALESKPSFLVCSLQRPPR